MGKLSNRDFFEDRWEHLEHLPEHILFDLARNDACPIEYRLTAVEIMVKKVYKRADHPDLARFREVLDAEKAELGEHTASEMKRVEREISSLEPEKHPESDPKPPSGPPAASVTTSTMFGSPPKSPENGQEDSALIPE